MKYNELKRILIKNGCTCEKEKANHEWWYSPLTDCYFPIGRHGKEEIATGTLKKIAKQSGLKL